MSFVDRVKSILLKKNEEELANIEIKIAEVERIHSRERENVRNLREEAKVISGEKTAVQKNILNQKDLKELEIIYNFIVNYPQIEKIIEAIRKISSMTDFISIDIYHENGTYLLDEELNYRTRLCSIVKKINEEINKILNEENPKENESEKDAKEINPSLETTKENKRGLFERLFKRNKTSKEPEKEEKVSKDGKALFNRYRWTIELFKTFYTSFLVVDLEGPIVVDKNIANTIMMNINNIFSIEKRGFELLEEDKDYLMSVQPHELWKEISKYYSNTMVIATIIQNFERHIDEFESKYKEKPELFDAKNLERIFEENNQMVVNLRQKNKVATAKNGEVLKKKQEEKEIRAQLKELEEKRKLIKSKNQKIREATSLRDLGYKSKEDAIKKLSIDAKDYIVIPISKDVSCISDIFAEEKRLKVEVDENTYFASYVNDVATGRINSIDDEKGIDAVLMVPIFELKKEEIDSVRSGKISLNKSVLENKNLVVIIPKGRKIDIGTSSVKMLPYVYDSLFRHVKEFLGDDYTNNSDETANYDLFKGIQNMSSKEKRLKRDAVKKCVVENVRRNVTSKDMINVNGKLFFLNKEDEIDIKNFSLLQPLNERELYRIADEIETYILEDGNNSIKIDSIYRKLLMEYMRVNRKAKADYYEEDNTITLVNGRKLSIKPILPAKDENIAKRYSRSKEDATYKAMKLTALVNKFAHLTENGELKNVLFDVKNELIEYAIDLSKDNPNINLRKKFDKDKMIMSVILEIPGYNMIALHMKNKSDSLSYKANRLEDATIDVSQTSTILIPGVNSELLMTLKNMKEEERIQFLVNMQPEVFYKLVLRMGYTSENISTESDRKKFIKEMTSDKKLDELLKETDELEK